MEVNPVVLGRQLGENAVGRLERQRVEIRQLGRIAPFVISKTKTGRKKNIIPPEVKSGTQTKHVSLDKFCTKFRDFTDSPTVLERRDHKIDKGVAHSPAYCTPMLLEWT